MLDGKQVDVQFTPYHRRRIRSIVGGSIDSLVRRTVESIIVAILPQFRPVSIVGGNASKRQNGDRKRQLGSHHNEEHLVVPPILREVQRHGDNKGLLKRERITGVAVRRGSHSFVIFLDSIKQSTSYSGQAGWLGIQTRHETYQGTDLTTEEESIKRGKAA